MALPQPVLEPPAPSATAPDEGSNEACQPLHVPALSSESVLQPAKLAVWRQFTEQVCDVGAPHPYVILINLDVSSPMLRSARDKQAVPQACDKGRHCLLASSKWHEHVQCAQGMFVWEASELRGVGLVCAGHVCWYHCRAEAFEAGHSGMLPGRGHGGGQGI